MKAHLLIRPQPWYRREAFAAGLARAGHDVRDERPRVVNENTLLVIWNRYGANHALATQVEQAGGQVIVAENGYLGRCGTTPKWDVYPKGPAGFHYYALARSGHNGSGFWFTGDTDHRWRALSIDLRPWRAPESPATVLILPSRQFGRPDMVQPDGWLQRTISAWSAAGWKVKTREHPGNGLPARPLQDDLAGVGHVHIWASSAGLHALIAGIPVTWDAPFWIGAGMREEAMRRLSWAQWTVDEIASGEPFDILCGLSTPADTSIA